MISVALPVTSRFTGNPSALAPSVNDTVPVGFAVPDAGVTVTVNVTDCAEFEGFGAEISAVDVFVFATAFTICESGVEALPL